MIIDNGFGKLLFCIYVSTIKNQKQALQFQILLESEEDLCREDEVGVNRIQQHSTYP